MNGSILCACDGMDVYYKKKIRIRVSQPGVAFHIYGSWKILLVPFTRLLTLLVHFVRFVFPLVVLPQGLLGYSFSHLCSQPVTQSLHQPVICLTFFLLSFQLVIRLLD